MNLKGAVRVLFARVAMTGMKSIAVHRYSPPRIARSSNQRRRGYRAARLPEIAISVNRIASLNLIAVSEGRRSSSSRSNRAPI
jgi:hypothetical protein